MYSIEPTKRQIKIIMKAFKPKGWKIIEWGKHDGKACPILRTICVPKVINKWALGYYLHECGHVHLGHVLLGNRNIQNPPGSYCKWHMFEAEAELFSFKALEACGFPPEEEYIQAAKDYVKTMIADDERFNRRIDPIVRVWANS